MLRIQSVAVGLVMAFSTMLMLSTAASANPIAGGGYSSSYAGESAFTSSGATETGQFSAIFFNDGTVAWSPGVVGLLICAADKQTCNISSNASYAKNWFSSTVYATVTTTVQPGQNGFFIYNFTVPVGTPPGTATAFYGDVGLIPTGAMLRPEGYFQINTTPQPTLTLLVSPSPASVAVGSTQQFTVTNLPTGAVATWSVLGGCGAITSSGLFAATAMNSSSQPCSVIVTASGSNGSSPVTVYGNATQLGCTASPSPIIANNGNTSAGISIAKITLKDANGNTVSNASSPSINVVNVTPTLATMTPTGVVSPANGVATVTMTSTATPGDIQLSASASGLAGCNVIVTSTGPGAASKTIATFLTNPIAADASSTTSLQVDVTDSQGNRIGTDNSTILNLTRDASSVNVCTITGVTTGTGSGSGGSATVTVAQGRIAVTFTATSTPGNCLVFVTTNNSSIAGTSVTLTTQIVGAPNRLAVLSNDSPHPAAVQAGCAPGTGNADLSCTQIVVGVQDVNGNLVTSSSLAITATLDSGSCAGAGGGPAVSRNTPATAAGKATFVFSSRGAYAGCQITFSGSSVSSVNATAVWTAGGADHLSCAFSPTSLPPDNTATAAGVVSVRDNLNNNATAAGTYSVNFQRSGGSSNTSVVTASPQNTNGGSAVFIVRTGTMVGSDTYTPTLASGSLSTAPTSCALSVQ